MITFAADLTVVWTPADLGSNLLGWFDGADAATVTIAGSGVSAWRNKGVSSFTLTQGLDAYKPSYAANAVVFADNSSQYLAAGSPPLAYDLLIVAKPNSYNDWRTLFLSVSGTTTENTILIQNTGQLGIYQATLNQAGGLTWANNTSGLCYAQISNAGPVLMSRDGGALASTGVAQLGIPLQGVGSSGSFDVHSYTQGFGAVYELTFVPYNSPLDTRQRLEGYAAWKWGLQALLPPDHPYKTAAPQAPGGATGSQYGQGPYAHGLYSRITPVDLAGDLSPSVSFSASLAFIDAIAGDLAPSVVFAADLTVTPATLLVGDLSPSIALGAGLAVIVSETGDLAPSVVFAADLSVTAATALAGDLAPSLTLSAMLTVATASSDLSGDIEIAPVFSAGLGVIAGLAGDLAPSVVFSSKINVIASVAGDLAPAVAFSADLAITPATEFAGDLAPAFALLGRLTADTVVAGGLAPIVAFVADLTIETPVEMAGDLAPQWTFAANLGLDVTLAGDLAPQINLEGPLTGDWLIAGDLSLAVEFAAELSSGPLWEASDACPSAPWDEAETCPPTLWTPTPPPNWELPGVSQGWGVGPYGMSVYQPSSSSPWLPPDPVETPPTWAPSAPPASVDWQETEPCDG